MSRNPSRNLHFKQVSQRLRPAVLCRLALSSSDLGQWEGGGKTRGRDRQGTRCAGEETGTQPHAQGQSQGTAGDSGPTQGPQDHPHRLSALHFASVLLLFFYNAHIPAPPSSPSSPAVSGNFRGLLLCSGAFSDTSKMRMMPSGGVPLGSAHTLPQAPLSSTGRGQHRS